MAELNWSLGLTPDFSSAIKYQEAGQANRQRQADQAQEQAKQAALSAYAQNPQTGLAGVIATDPRTGIALQDQQLKADKARRDEQAATETKSYQAKISLAKALVHVPRGEQRAQTFSSLAPLIPGVRPEDIQALQAHVDDDSFLNGLAGEYTKKLEFMNLGEGYGVAVDPTSGQRVAEYQAPRRVKLGEGEQLVELPGGGGPQGASNPVTDIRGTIERIVPGARITSGLRTPEHNAEVGGAKNSYHLSGNALDIVPPPGVSMAQLREQIASSGIPTAELLNEGDHVHVAWKGQSQSQQPQGGARVIAQGAPKRQTRLATNEEKAAYGIAADVPAQVKPDGSIDVITGTGAALKPVPPKIQEGIVGNRSSIRQIDEAIAAIQANPGALGLKNYAPEGLTQRLDLKGVPTRAGVANIGSLLIHDRSGAAVTASETPRLKPFIPSATDTPQAAVAKLQGLRRQLENSSNEMEITYGEGSGYRPMGGQQSGAPAPKRGPGVSFQPNDQQKRALTGLNGSGPAGAISNPVILNPNDPSSSFGNLKSGQYFIGPDGQVRKKP